MQLEYLNLQIFLTCSFDMINFLAMSIFFYLGEFVFAVVLLGLLVFNVFSAVEKEKRAFQRSFYVILGMLFLNAFVLLLPFIIKNIILGAFFLLFILVLIFILFSPKPNKSTEITGKQRKIDERDIIFSRFDLKQGSHLYHEYYKRKKEYKNTDDRIRKNPDILTSYHMARDRINFSLADSEFDFLEYLLNRTKADISSEKMNMEKPKNTRLVKNVLKYLGADISGICELDQSYVYSHVGRGPNAYGSTIECKHKYAIVFAIKMNFEFISMSPKPPVIVETAHKYVKAANISIVTANFIRKLGHPARAHFAGSDYKAMVPPLAYKAGLGEIGRLGILITEDYGPRVRLGLITTDLPLDIDKPRVFGVQSFCETCKKCALNCPSRAIPFGEKKEENGSFRWIINREACYEFWRKCGTDCAKCIYVCPYSKPNNLMHNIIRIANSKSTGVQKLCLKGDDFFYGTHPKEKKSLDWTK